MYCKWRYVWKYSYTDNSINSSKVYCKWHWQFNTFRSCCVLIVAKCIVNLVLFYFSYSISPGINSSKVYCKFTIRWNKNRRKIRINSSKVYCKSMLLPGEYNALAGINSSKVYCKLPFLTAEVVDYLKY